LNVDLARALDLLLVQSFNLLGDGWRHALDPRHTQALEHPPSANSGHSASRC